MGRSLIEAICVDASSRGFENIFLEADPVDDILKAAFGLKPTKIFESWGFVGTTLHRKFCKRFRDRPDFIIMQCRCSRETPIPQSPVVLSSIFSPAGSAVVVMHLQQAVEQHPQVLQLVAAWEARAFGGRSAEERIPSFDAVATGRKDASPWGYLSVLVAFNATGEDDSGGPQVMGAVSLVKDDLAWRQLDHGHTPWLSNLFVPRQFRRKGVARALTDAAMAEAARLGHQHLFLYFDPSDTRLITMYQRWGFSFTELDRRLVGGQSWKHGTPLIQAMQKSLNDNDENTTPNKGVDCIIPPVELVK